jgi:hypothetical protein
VREITIVEDLSEKSRSDRLAGVHWHGSDAAIRMAQPVMAAVHANHFETGRA